jgi:hypothetical protein
MSSGFGARGNVLVAGDFAGPMDLGPRVLTAPGNGAIFLANVDADGAVPRRPRPGQRGRWSEEVPEVRQREADAAV